MSEITLDYNKLSDFEQYNLIKKLYEFENCKEEYSFSENKKKENNFDSFMSKKIKELKEKPITITKETYDYLKDSYIKSNVFWSLGKAVFESYKDNFTEDKRILTGCLKSSEDFNSWIDKNKEKDYNLSFISNDKNSSTVINSILNNIPENKRVMLRKDKIFLENEFTENNYESKEININQLCKLCIDEAQRKNDKVVNEWKERFNSELNEYIPAIRHVKILNEYLERFDNSIQENLDKKIESQLNGGMDDFLIEKELENNQMIESEEEESDILTDEEISFLDDFNKKTKEMNMKVIDKSYQYFAGTEEVSTIDYALECDDFTHKRLMEHLDNSYIPKKSILNDDEKPIIEFRKSMHPESFPDQILVGYYKKSPSGNTVYKCSTVDDSFTKDITRMINETCNEYNSQEKENFLLNTTETFENSANKILNKPENQLKKLEHEIFQGLDELEKNNVTSMSIEHISFIKEAVKEKINNNTNTNESTHKGGRK